MDKVHAIYDELTELDKIPYELAYYKKMVIKDVNNYLGIYTDGSTKSKGCFMDYEDIMKEKAFHKDTSAMIIPYAIKQYYMNGISVEDTILSCNDIYEFLYAAKGSESSSWLITNYNEQLRVSTSKLENHRCLRYYAGGLTTLSKLWTSGKRKDTIEAIEASTPVTLLLNVPKTELKDLTSKGVYKPRYSPDGKEFVRYPSLNKEYYINKAYEVIDSVTPTTNS